VWNEISASADAKKIIQNDVKHAPGQLLEASAMPDDWFQESTSRGKGSIGAWGNGIGNSKGKGKGKGKGRGKGKGDNSGGGDRGLEKRSFDKDSRRSDRRRSRSRSRSRDCDRNRDRDRDRDRDKEWRRDRDDERRGERRRDYDKANDVYDDAPRPAVKKTGHTFKEAAAKVSLPKDNNMSWVEEEEDEEEEQDADWASHSLTFEKTEGEGLRDNAAFDSLKTIDPRAAASNRR